MARSLNKVQLIGNLGADPEIRFTQDGRPIATLRLATTDSWKDQQGQVQERTEWHRVVIFGKVAEIAQQYLRKGSKVYIEGQLQTRKWTDNQGQERYTTEVALVPFNGQMLMLDGKPGGGSPGAAPAYGSGNAYNQPSDMPAQEYRASPPPSPAAGRSFPTSGGSSSGGPPPLDEYAQTPDFDDDIPF